MNHFFTPTRTETKRVLMTPSMADELLKLNTSARMDDIRNDIQEQMVDRG